MKKIIVLCLIGITFLTFSCSNDSGSDKNLEEIKALAQKLPDSIDLDPVGTSSQGTWRGIDDLSDGDYSFDDLAPDLFMGMSMVAASIEYTKASIADSVESNEDVIQNLNASLTLGGIDPSLYSLTMQKLKYSIISEKLVLWMKVFLTYGDGGSVVELDMKAKITASETGLELLLAMDEGLGGSYANGVNRYWLIEQDYSSNDIDMFESYKETGLYYTIQNRKFTNSAGKHDFSSIKIEGTDNAGKSGFVLYNRSDAIYGEDFFLDSNGDRVTPTEAGALVIFNTSGTMIGRIGSDDSSATFNYNSHTYTLSDYQNNWPSDHAAVISSAVSSYKSEHSSIQPTVENGTFFPHSEFDGF